MSVLNTLPIVIFSAAMIFAAVRDLTTMTIPNWLTLGLTIAFFISAVSLGMPLADIARHASAGFALLLIGMGLFARGWIGGGDAKLVAAASLWLGWGDALPYLLLASIFGGGLTLFILFYRTLPLPMFLYRQGWLLRLHDRKEGVPYGIALAVAGLFIFPQTEIFRLVSVLS
ncbi:MAG: prepilin peptidase [Parvibaculum sp.]|uniref:A24 family peptidase n=1 Tax=Parvibaculum sp. TaxID=2024848 RepID=UPI003C738139